MPLSNFTVLLSLPLDYSGSMHIHVLNVEMSHDDYTHLCNLINLECEYKQNDFAIHLNCPTNVFLISYKDNYSSKIFYIPVCLIQYEKYFCKENSAWKLREINKFAPLLNKMELASLMTPLPKENATFLMYPTRIAPLKIYQRVNQFTSCLNGCKYTFVKENKLVETDSKNRSFCYQFFKQNAYFIDSIVTFNFDIFKTWYKNFSFKEIKNINVFEIIDKMIRKKCVHMKHEKSPVNTLLHSNFFLPVFYSLCNLKYFGKKAYIKEKPEFRRWGFGYKRYFRTYKQFPSYLPEETAHLDFDTILYCAFKMFHNDTNHAFHFIFKGMEWIFELIEDMMDFKKNLKVIQKRFFPIVKNSKDEIYTWDPILNIWLKVEEIKAPIEKIYDIMKGFEGFSKIPEGVRFKLENSNWIDSILNDILIELKVIDNFK